MKHKPKLIRITTVPQSLRGLLKGQMRFMSENGFEVVAVSSPGEALQDVEKNEGVKTVGIEMTRSITPIQDLKALVQLIQLFRKEKPQIVHTHTPKAGLLGMMAAKIAGVPHRLHTVAGMPLLVTSGFKRRLLNFIEKLTYTCATKVYPNSEGLKKIIINNNFTSEKKLKVIGYGSSNGIDTSKFNQENIDKTTKENLLRKLNINENDVVFLFVGRIVKDKGVNELIDAFQLVSKEYNTIHLIIVGDFDGNLNQIDTSTKEKINSDIKIHHVGVRFDVESFFAISDIFVFPSYREGFPNVVMEAAAMQLNSIVTDINGSNEIIKNGFNGWVIPVCNVNILVDKMKWCIENLSKITYR